MGYDINWNTTDAAVLRHPFYITYSVKSLGQCIDARVAIKTEMAEMLMSNDSAAIIAYASWLVRTITLVTG